MTKITDSLLDFGRAFKTMLAEACEDRFTDMYGLPDDALNEHLRRDAIEADYSTMDEEEKFAVIKLKELARQFGSDPGQYAEGTLIVTFKNKQAVTDYLDAVDSIDEVEDYEVEARREVMVDGYMDDKEYDFDDVLFDKDFEFDVFVYLDPAIVTYAPVEIDATDDEREQMVDDINGVITEVRRRIKVNFRGRRRIKMQCRRGFKWDNGKHACIKITGADAAQMRKRHRRAVRTKKAKGASFKVRLLRKTRRARRFRKSMGLKG